MPGSIVRITPPEPELMTAQGSPSAKSGSQPFVDGFGNPANGSASWGRAVLTVTPAGQVLDELPAMSTCSVLGAILNRAGSVWSLIAAVLLVEFTRMPPPVRCTSALLFA